MGRIRKDTSKMKQVAAFVGGGGVECQPIIDAFERRGLYVEIHAGCVLVFA